MRRLYPPLLVLLLIVVVVGLLNRGGASSDKSAAQSPSVPRSVFPTPSAVPTPTPPPVVVPAPATDAPTQTANQQSNAAQAQACPPLQLNGRAVSVSILQGQVTCQSARAVVRAFKSGKGRHGGPPDQRYVTVRGWRCVLSGTCTRPGKSIRAS